MMIQPAGSRAGPVLVTGASGFVGSAIVQAFGRAGYPVRALVRRSSVRTNLIDSPCEVVEGDVRDRGAVAAALAGVRYLVHAAADYRLWAPAADDMLHVNVEGTRIVMEEALRAGVERLVYTSSVATLALRGDGSPADETRMLGVEQAIGAYKRSKVLAERVVQDLVETSGLPAVIVNPSAPIGPRDIKPTPTGRMIVQAASGRMPAFVDTGLNLAHVDDIAAGHLAALERGRIGERYILGGENVLLYQMLAEIAHNVGRPFDVPHEADTLPGQQVHRVEVSAGVAVGRESHEPQYRHGDSADHCRPDLGFVGTGLLAARFVAQPLLHEGGPQRPMRCVRPPVPEQRGAHRVALGCVEQPALVIRVGARFGAGEKSSSQHGGLCAQRQGGN